MKKIYTLISAFLVSLSFSAQKGIKGENITDVEGNTYKSVTLGTQTWMAENLKTSKYNDGTIIPNITDDTLWSNLNSGAWVYYNNDIANNAKYGKLYNWYAVNPTTNGNKNVCPAEWHIPTETEWTVLIEYLGGEIVAGGKMKEVGTKSWNRPNEDASNSSLFTGLPGGGRFNYKLYGGIGVFGYWWGSTEESTSDAWSLTMFNDGGGAYRAYGNKRHGLSVRCLKN